MDAKARAPYMEKAAADKERYITFDYYAHMMGLCCVNHDTAVNWTLLLCFRTRVSVS